MKNGQFPAVIQLSSLNGVNGFILDGENGGGYSGYSVSAAGDINGDGHNDLLIGAPIYSNRTGRSYVVFGGPGVGNNGTIALSSLNGANGFKLDGENNGDSSGNSVSSVGDINDDGYDDLLMGAPFYPNFSYTPKGRSYVVFGGTAVGNSGIIVLSSLNGANGFKLDGENNAYESGYSVSTVGDINVDGYNDLLIAAPLYPNNIWTGRSYVVFGGPGVGNNGTMALSNLNGANGFKLDGENNGSAAQPSYSVSAAGDINSDGHADLIIGTINAPNGYGKGRSYVVFGGLGVGNNGTIALSSLNGVNGFKLDGENNGDYSGYSVSAAGDVNGDGHDDLLIGAYEYPG